MVDFFRGKIIDHLSITGRSELDYNLGFSQPRFLLRPGLIKGNLWLDALFEYCEKYLTFDFKTMEQMWRLMLQFQPLDFFTTMTGTELILLWIQLERFSADEGLIHLLVQALKLRVLNPTLGLSQQELTEVIAKLVAESVQQVLAPADVADDFGSNEFRPASMVFSVEPNWLPPVTWEKLVILPSQYSYVYLSLSVQHQPAKCWYEWQCLRQKLSWLSAWLPMWWENFTLTFTEATGSNNFVLRQRCLLD